MLASNNVQSSPRKLTRVSLEMVSADFLRQEPICENAEIVNRDKRSVRSSEDQLHTGL